MAKSTAERLKKAHGWRGVTRGRRVRTTTVPGPSTARAPDLVRRQFKAARPVANGEAIFGARGRAAGPGLPHRHRAAAARRVPELSEREREVLSLLAEGRSNPDIAQLYLSPKTVRNHFSNIVTELQVADRAQAIVKARGAGLGTAERSPWPSPLDGSLSGSWPQ